VAVTADISVLDVALTNESIPPSYFFGDATFFGSGCNLDNAQFSTFINETTQEVVVKMIFLHYTAGASDKRRDRQTCDMAVPIDVAQGICLDILKLEYYGHATAPLGDDSYATLSSEAFYAGSQGIKMNETFRDYVRDFSVASSNEGEIVSSPCGGATILRINIGITANKKKQR